MIGPSFEAVLAAAAGGDELAFGILWRDLQPGLLRYLNALAPGAGEDLASETWLRVVGRLDRFAGDERAFRAWVFTGPKDNPDKIEQVAAAPAKKAKKKIAAKPKAEPKAEVEAKHEANGEPKPATAKKPAVKKPVAKKEPKKDKAASAAQ
jgi:hypothetical protein